MDSEEQTERVKPLARHLACHLAAALVEETALRAEIAGSDLLDRLAALTALPQGETYRAASDAVFRIAATIYGAEERDTIASIVVSMMRDQTVIAINEYLAEHM